MHPSATAIYDRMRITPPRGAGSRTSALVRYDAGFAAFQEYYEPHNIALRRMARTVAHRYGWTPPALTQTQMPI